MKKLGTEDFILKARGIHGEAYDYSQAIYKGSNTKIKIGCRVPGHGSFEQTPSNHYAGKGCSKCRYENLAGERRLPLEEVTARLEHLGLSGVTTPRLEMEYQGIYSKITIECGAHGMSQVRASRLVKGAGCPKCGKAGAVTARTKGGPSFIAEATALYKGKFSYIEVGYENAHTMIDIICNKHSITFRQTPSNHLRGKSKGCRVCVSEYRAGRQAYTAEDAIDRFREAHGMTYSRYNMDGYLDMHSPVGILCPTHGWFNQSATSHVTGCGCPKCGRSYAMLSSEFGSKAQGEITGYLRSLGLVVEEDVKPFRRTKHEIDAYLPELKIGVEFNGLWFHSSKFKLSGYHKMKQDMAAEEGIRLVQIFTDEWLYRKDTCKRALAHLVGKSPKSQGGARNLEVVKVTGKEARVFYEHNHLQGPASPGGLHLGLADADGIVCMMTFAGKLSKRGQPVVPGRYELARFATTRPVPGGASRLFKQALKVLGDVQTVVSYSDNRWFTGGMYEQLGFRKTGQTQPNYTYTKSGDPKRHNKMGFQKKQLKVKLGEKYDPTNTEKEMCEQLGYYRVYDCGLTRWEWYC